MKSFFLLLMAVFLWSCQHKPTVVVSEAPILLETDKGELQKWLQTYMQKQPVILDARSPFDYNLSHVPSAVNVRWEDFSQQDPHSRGLLDPDLFALARRLALIGVTPETPVLVLGKAHEGQGEEGRIAWTLQVLGVKSVQTLHHKELRALRVQDPAPVQNKPMWKPQEDESLSLRVDRFKNFVMGVRAQPPFPSKARTQALGVPAQVAAKITTDSMFGMPFPEVQKRLVILDVRSPELFKNENMAQKKGVKAPVVSLFWKKFFSEKGLVNPAVKAELSKQNITPDSVLFVISNYGLESAAVTYALRVLGYPHSTNFAGGYEQWNVSP